MSIGALVVPGLFNDHITTGLAPADTELRITLLERWNANAPWASETSIEYAMWDASVQLGGIGDPPIQGNSEITDGTGEIAINTAGVFTIGQDVYVAIKKVAAGPSSEDVYGFGKETITEV